MKNPKIIILCGGKGVRLKPLTDDIPKPLVEIKGKPVLHHAIELYSKKGFNDFILCIGYKGNLIKEYFSKFPKYNIEYSDSGEDASMLKRVYDVKKLVGDKIIVCYGDTYADINFQKLIDFHNSKKGMMTIVTSPIKSPFGLVDLHEKEGKVTSFKEKPTLNYYMGYSVINKEAFNNISEDLLNAGGEEGWTLFFKKLIEMGKFNSYSNKGLHITFNTHSQKKVAEDIFKYYTDWRPEDEE